MRKYITPEIEEIRVNAEDIIMASSELSPKSMVGEKVAEELASIKYDIFDAE